MAEEKRSIRFPDRADLREQSLGWERLEGQIRRTEERVRRLKDELRRFTGIEEAQQQSLLETLKEQETVLSRQKARAGELQRELIDRADAKKMRRASDSMEEGLRSLAAQVALAGCNTALLRGALGSLRQSLAAAFAPVFNAAAPALLWLIELISRAAEAVGWFFTLLGGAQISEAAGDSESWARGLRHVGGAAREAKRYLSGLDEIRTWPEETGGGGGSAPAAEGGGENGRSGMLAAFLRENLEAAELLADEFALVLGVVLTFSGANIPLGLGLMAYGGYKLFKDVKENWGAISGQLQGPMGAVMALVNGALLVIGAILAFSGVNIPLGIGLMAAGAGGLAAVTTANWDGLVKWFREGFNQVGAVIRDWWNNKVKPWFSKEKWTALGEKAMAWLKSRLTLGAHHPVREWWNARIAPWFTKEKWTTIGERAMAWLKSRLTLGAHHPVREWWQARIAPWFTKEKWQGIGEKAMAWLKSVLGLGDHDPIKTWWDAHVAPWFTWEKWTGIANTAVSAVKNALGLGSYDPIKSWWDEHVAPWFTWDKWKELGGKAIEGIKDGLSSLTLPKFSLSWETANKTFEVLGQTISMNIPWPKLGFAARGGIVDAATLFGRTVIGEDGKEAIVPLEKHTEWIGLVAKELAERLSEPSLPGAYPQPLLATGTVTPPRASLGGSYELDEVISRLDALLHRQERPIELSASFRAEVSGRTLFHEVLREGRNSRTASGRNPFEL